MKKPEAKIFVNHPECSIESASGIYEALHSRFTVDFFGVDELSDKFLKNTDLVIFPGGIGDSDSFDYLLKPRRDIINNFIASGGGYLGICMGAYWAGSLYFNIAKGIRPVQYIKRPRSEIRRSFSTTLNIDWNQEPKRMFFYDGCSLLGDHSKFQTIATYSNGDPMAVIQNKIGLIGCHPESMPSWYNKRYLKPHWHNFSHHKLLLDFAVQLL